MSKFEKILYIVFFIALAVVFIRVLLFLLLMLVLVGFLRTWQMKYEPNQQEFSRGRLPNPALDGFYRGNAGFSTAWIGKKFYAEKSAGINVVKSKTNAETEKYPFKTAVGTGLFDPKVFVLKIDYNIKGNAFWIRWILDEIVQVGPDEYLGKMHLRIIPGFAFSLLYFELKK